MFMRKVFEAPVGVIALCVLLAGAAQAAGDVEGSADHPLVSRYEGARITKYDAREFDEYKLLTGRVGGGSDGSPLALEGRVTKIRYEIDKTRSTLEVFRNYETALQDAGFEELFSCKNRECGGRDFNHAVIPYDILMSENFKDQRYVAAKLTRPEGTAYVALYIVKAYSIGGPRKNNVYVQLDIVETTDMETDKVTVDADAIGKGLDGEGHVAVYGIYFDTDSARVKPESGATLKEIARLMRARPDLHLLVVGHTDNRGTLEYNLDLSRRRAAAVVAALAADHGIDAARLTPAGVGFLAPVASNDSDKGRAANRRVELVAR